MLNQAVRLGVGDKITARGANQNGRYVKICDGHDHWLAWEKDDLSHQSHKGKCDCPK